MRIPIFFLLLALSVPSHAYPQPQPTRLVSGMVISGDGSGPLEGVAVAVKGTNIISGSQQDGMYYIEVPLNDSILVFAHDEYQTAEIKLAGGNEYHVVLNKRRDRQQTGTALSVSGSWRAVFGIRPGMDIYIFTIHATIYHYLSRLRCRYCRCHPPTFPGTGSYMGSGGRPAAGYPENDRAAGRPVRRGKRDGRLSFSAGHDAVG